MDRPGRTTKIGVTAMDGPRSSTLTDLVATEEPLEIRLSGMGDRRTIAVTMRTPGADFELAAGFLFTEGVLGCREDIAAIRYCTDRDVGEEQRFNIVTVDLTSPIPDLATMERHFLTSSACGVCGSATLQALTDRDVKPVVDGPEIDPAMIAVLPEAMRQAQETFDVTGGLHAAGIFTSDGEAIVVREDVGRHNAVDKTIGWALLQDHLPLAEHILMVSGRSSYEIVQKAIVARIPIIASVSAPSSLAVHLAEAFNVTLLGFVRDKRMNVYAHRERLKVHTR